MVHRTTAADILLIVGSVSVHLNFIVNIFMVSLSVLLQAAKRGKKDKHKVGQKRQQKKGSDDSDASSEEDGYLDSKEMDYLSDTSSSSEGQ